MSILDLSSLHRGGGAGQPADALQQRALTAHGIVARAPTSESDSMHVVIKGMSLDQGYEVIAGHWTPRGSTLPAVGTDCLIVFDDEGDAFVPVWSGTTSAIADITINVRNYGARGDGTTDDTAAIMAAAASAAANGGAVYFPKGTYNFNPTGSTPITTALSHPTFIGEDVATTIINVGNGGYFLDNANAWFTMVVRDLTFSGTTPAGFFRSTYSGVNVQNPKVFERCLFQNHQICAVQSNASDEPYWKFDNCRFFTTNVTTAIDVALAGQADSCEFISTAFTGARVNVKLRNSFTAKFTDCDFIPWSAQSGGVQRARVWLVPTQSTGSYGTRIMGCKFGNESIGSGDFHILIAGELSGTHVGDMQPDLSTVQTNPFAQLVVDSFFAGASGAAPPAVYTMTQSLPGCRISPTWQGSLPTYTVQYNTPPTVGNRLEDGLVIGPVSVPSTEVALPLATNANAMRGHPNDGPYMLAHDPVAPLAGPGDVAELVNLSPPSINGGGWGTVNAGLVAATDRRGGTDAATITSTLANGDTFHSLGATPTIGAPGWIEFDLQRGAVSPVATVTVLVLNNTTGHILFKRILTPTAAWVRHRYPLAFAETAANVLVEFQLPAIGSVIVGRVKVYHARAPISIEPGFPIADTTTTAPGAGGAGALPATPLGYATVMVNGAERKIAYY